MASLTGYVTAGASAGSGSSPWYNPGNITAQDAVNATTSETGNGSDTYFDSKHLQGTNPNLGVPSGAAIDGVLVRIRRKSDHNGATDYIKDFHLKLIKGGTAQGDDKADTTNKWPLTLTDASYGGAADKWNLTLTDADVNANNFGVDLVVRTYDPEDQHQVGSFVDAVEMTIYYTVAGKKFCSVLCSKINGVTVSKFDGVN